MVEKLPSSEPGTQKRRSTRIVQSIPITVSGVDALGQPFRERTSTLIINCHGCRYQSKHYVLKNTPVSFEVPHPEPAQAPRIAKGRVLWIQRPRTVRELFQIGIELDTPGNVWGIAFPPEDWFPYPEPSAPELPAPGPAKVSTSATPPAARTETPAAKSETRAALPPAPPLSAELGEKVLTLPLPSSSEISALLARQMARLMAEAKPTIQQIAREAAASAMVEETAQVLRDLNAQLTKAAERAVSTVLESQGERVAERAVEKMEDARRSMVKALQEEWAREIAAGLGKSREQLAAGLADTGAGFLKDFAKRLEEEAGRASERLAGIEQQMHLTRGEVAAGADAAAARMRDLEEGLGREAESARAMLRAEADSAQARVQDLSAEIDRLLASSRGDAQADTDAALIRLRDVQAEFESSLRVAEFRIAELRSELVRSADQAHTNWDLRLRDQAEEGNARLASLAESAKNLNRDMAAAAEQAYVAWRERVAAQTNAAGEQWNQQVETTLAAFAEKLAARLAEISQNTALATEQEIAARATSVRLSFEVATTEAQHAIKTLRDQLAEEMKRAEEGTAGVEAASARLEKLSVELENASRAAAESLDKRFEAILADHTARIDARSRVLLADMAAQMQPAFEAAGEKSVAQFVRRVEEGVAPHLERADQAAARLAAGEQQAEQALASYRQRLQADSEQYLRGAVAWMQKMVAQTQEEFEKSSRAALTQSLTELDAKTTDATHTAFESLYKSAEWYQKKAQVAMQLALDKALEQAATTLRDKAAEMSRLFNSELDHYSRSYAAHTQGMLEEAAKELVGRSRGQLGEAAETTAASFGDEVHKIAQQKLDALTEESRATFDATSAQLDARATDARTQMDALSREFSTQAEAVARATREDAEALARTIREQSDAYAEHSAAEFQRRVKDMLQLSVYEANQDFQASLLPIMDSWRADREAQQKEWVERIAQQSNESMEQYKERLQNASNSWMVASVTALNQHSVNVMNVLSKAAEQRLREACAQALTGLGETLRQRLVGLSLEFLPPTTPPEQK